MTDLIVKGAGGIKDGLYVIKDGEMFKYKSKGGTVRTYQIADRPRGEWIPCSERMPENGHYYLWCSDMGNVQSDYYWNGFENGMKYKYNIIAWMPLPEPYKESDDK